MRLLVVDAISSEKSGKYSVKTDTSPLRVWRAMDLPPGPWKGMVSLGPYLWCKFGCPIMYAKQILLSGSNPARGVSNNIAYMG